MLDNKIKYFIYVVEEGSLSAAARKLYLSQPALSKQIRQLEKELGIQLLDRSGYKPVLTKSGEKFYRGIKNIEKEYDELLDLIYKEEHIIKIGFTGVSENRKSINVIHAIKNEFRNLNFNLLECNFEESLNRLLSKEIDISFGIESTFKYNQNIEYFELFKHEMCIICSFDHKLTNYEEVSIEQLREEKFILLSKKFGKYFYKDFIESCREDKFKPRVAKEVDSFDELIFEVAIGSGIAIVSNDVVKDSDVKKIKLINSHHTNKYVVACLKESNDFVKDIVSEIIAFYKKTL